MQAIGLRQNGHFICNVTERHIREGADTVLAQSDLDSEALLFAAVPHKSGYCHANKDAIKTSESERPRERSRRREQPASWGW